MKVTTKKYSRNELRAEKRSFGGKDQPLKPVNRKAGKLVFSAVVVLFLVGGAVAKKDDISSYINRPVAKVRMETMLEQVTEEDVGAALEKHLGLGFFNLDTHGIKLELEKMSWVDFASVKRVWPDTLSLVLTEEKAIARWGQRSYLNSAGSVFSPDSAANSNALPHLSGPEGSQVKVMQQYLSLNQLLLPEGLRMTELALSERGSWDLVLNETIHVSAGKEDAFENLDKFVRVLVSKRDIDLSTIASVDLRYRNGFAIKNLESELSGVAAR